MVASSAGETRPLRADARRNRERILGAAGAVFAEHGPAASTEQVAERAGVAIGTVFRHFPTKRDLLQAIMKDLLARLTAEATALAADGDPATALFTFFARLVEQSANQKTVIESLTETGTDLPMAGAVGPFRDQIATLLERAQAAGAVRPGVRTDEVMALLAAQCQGALHGGWDADLRGRTLAIVFAGLRHP
ncbi:TetR family transcriptional regulator [Sphaerisporangium rufum]|uniref:TetR family transcriptional regulator n=1 Tax=Sphaerisporangium rufum TaxID=1381558 RepID=A0A919R8K7_9ACTN|nr:TetR/AcrR family transcriptional regulator [Sphaerisporangium rufum]GII81409.1 TetR family transcriptional regulator [Sphaerisporangium rufum]